VGVTGVTSVPAVADAPVAIILAAGAGTRMGGPKVFAQVRNVPFAALIHRELETLGWPAIWVLRSPDQAGPLGLLLGGMPVYCINANPEGDMLSSVLAGLNAPASRLARSFCLWPVDFPMVGARTLRGLADGLDGADAVLPAREGRTGMPLVVARHTLCRWVSVLPRDGLRQAMREHPVRVRLLDVSDDGPFRNLNTPADCLAASENPD